MRAVALQEQGTATSQSRSLPCIQAFHVSKMDTHFSKKTRQKKAQPNGCARFFSPAFADFLLAKIRDNFFFMQTF
jgi:hypothetical protein